MIEYSRYSLIQAVSNKGGAVMAEKDKGKKEQKKKPQKSIKEKRKEKKEKKVK